MTSALVRAGVRGLLVTALYARLAMAAGDASPELLALVPLVLTLLLPWGFLRRVLVPLGQVRAAHLLARLTDEAAGHDAPGVAVLAAALALLHKTNASDEDVRWVEEQLARAAPLRAAGLSASAVLRLRGGDVDGARQTFESVERLRLPGAPALALRIAREWLAADAAARGDWARVAAIAARPDRLATSRATVLLGAVARRLLGDPGAPGDGVLWLSWLAAPHRRRTRPLLRRALAASRSVPASTPDLARGEDAYEPPVDPLQAALALAARLGRAAPPTLDQLTRLGVAWDRALGDAAIERRLLVRSMELGSHDGARVRAQLGEEAARRLADCARVQGLRLGSIEAPGPTIERATRLLRDELLTELEVACEALRRRATEQRQLPAADEWREWLAIRERYEQLGRLAGDGARRLAWPRVRDDVCKLAVWLWNTRGEKTIAHVMFRWLLDEATALDDVEAVTLQRKNVDCGIG